MSDFGLTVYGDAGQVQIDHNYFNLAMTVKSSGSFSPSDASQYSILTVTVPAEIPIIAWVSTFPVGLKSQVNNGNGTWTFVLVCASAYNGYGITYFVFDRPGGATSNWGLQVFDANGKKTFDSGYKYMKFRGNCLYQGYNASNATASLTGLPAGRTYAATMAKGGMSYFSFFQNNTGNGASWDCLIWLYAIMPTSDGCAMSQINVREFTAGSSQTSPFQTGLGMVIDVTGY
ncbi:hypothetical protein [Collimonas humicola]|uniref:hypothetical protein n=1 Tax=Collimonas humicola TaxID=2825886 RepID=UPI001B8B226A|nr:hypothetical protein [Collimonas humicola]